MSVPARYAERRVRQRSTRLRLFATQRLSRLLFAARRARHARHVICRHVVDADGAPRE